MEGYLQLKDRYPAHKFARFIDVVVSCLAIDFLMLSCSLSCLLFQDLFVDKMDNLFIVRSATLKKRGLWVYRHHEQGRDKVAINDEASQPEEFPYALWKPVHIKRLEADTKAKEDAKVKRTLSMDAKQQVKKARTEAADKKSFLLLFSIYFCIYFKIN